MGYRPPVQDRTGCGVHRLCHGRYACCGFPQKAFLVDKYLFPIVLIRGPQSQDLRAKSVLTSNVLGKKHDFHFIIAGGGGTSPPTTDMPIFTHLRSNNWFIFTVGQSSFPHNDKKFVDTIFEFFTIRKSVRSDRNKMQFLRIMRT